MLQKTIEFVVQAHAGQYRKGKAGNTALPYVVHPIAVMTLLHSWGIGDVDVLNAALCHDVLEDTATPDYEIEKVIGNKALNYVRELTFKEGQDKALYMKSFEKSTIEALVIKIADRLNNVLDFLHSEPQYASKYFHKADALYDAMMDRDNEIQDKFGRDVWYSLLEFYVSVKSELTH